MKRLLLIVLMALILPSCSIAQKQGFKFSEKSGQKPEWVGKASMPGYIIVHVDDKATLEEATAEAMTKVRVSMASTIATFVVNNTDLHKETNIKNGIAVTETEFESTTKARVAKMPAIKGVSISKADTYYEVFKNKKSGEKYYQLYVKYPFTQAEIDEMTAIYEKQEEDINNRIYELDMKLNEIETVEQIASSIVALSSLKEELDEIDARVKRIDGIIKLYNAIYGNISIDIVENNPGKIVFNLVYDGKKLKTSQMPKMSSNCAYDIVAKNVGDKVVVTYNSEYCYAQDDNRIDLKYNFGTKNVKKTVYFKLR